MQTKITLLAPAISTFCCTILSTLFSFMYAQEVETEIDFFDNQAQVVAIASAMHRPIMLVIDGPSGSASMERGTFRDPDVVAFLNENFANYRISLNSGEGSIYYNEFKLGKYLLKDYPIYIFLEEDGHTPISVNIETGYKTAEVMLDMAGKALAKKSQAISFKNTKDADLKNKAQAFFASEIRYQNDVRDESAVRELLYHMKEWESVDEKVLLEYFSLRDYSIAYEQCQQIVLDFSETIQSPAFIELLAKKSYLYNVKGKGLVDKKIKSAIRAGVIAASIKRDRAALDNALDVIDRAELQDAQDYKAEMLVLYYEKIADWNGIAKTMNEYCGSGKARNFEFINTTALKYVVRTDDKTKLEAADNWLKTAEYLKPNNYINLEAQAIILHKAGTKKNKKDLLDRALAEAKRVGDNKHSVSLLNLISLMENKAAINLTTYNPEFLAKQ